MPEPTVSVSLPEEHTPEDEKTGVPSEWQSGAASTFPVPDPRTPGATQPAGGAPDAGPKDQASK